MSGRKINNRHAFGTTAGDWVFGSIVARSLPCCCHRVAFFGYTAVSRAAIRSTRNAVRTEKYKNIYGRPRFRHGKLYVPDSVRSVSTTRPSHDSAGGFLGRSCVLIEMRVNRSRASLVTYTWFIVVSRVLLKMCLR